MPTYEYRCAKGHSFDVFQKMSDAPVATCPDCGAAAERVVSGGAGFLFKGEGFYITETRSEDYKKKAEADRGHAPAPGTDKPSGKSGATGSEPATKKESSSGSGASSESSSGSSSKGGSSGSTGSSGSSGSSGKDG